MALISVLPGLWSAGPDGNDEIPQAARLIEIDDGFRSADGDLDARSATGMAATGVTTGGAGG
jgi:hypothetical protein